MKKSICISAAILFLVALVNLKANSQENPAKTDESGYKFTDVKIIPHTTVKNQNRSGTCWSYAGTSFVEAEILKNGGKELDLSEMFAVRNAYKVKAVNYVKLHGAANMGPGGEPHQVLESIAANGLLPETAYNGLAIGTELPVHNEMDNALEANVKAIVENKNGTLTPVWKRAFEGLLDAYLGEVPAEFGFDGKQYSAKSFANENGNPDPNNYVEITSFNDQENYKPFLLLMPDNWDFEQYYNVPLDEMTEIIDFALENGFSVAWAADVSDKGFNHKKGVALVPEKDWSKMSAGEKDSVFIEPVKQKNITPELRLQAFEDYSTTDDHSMHIIGLAKDQDGNTWYKVKNSWGTENSRYDGYFYASVPYIKYKTIAIYLNKKAVPKNISKNLGL